MTEQKSSRKREPVFIVKPALKHGGLDYLHISLIALVVILVALAFTLAYFKPATLLQGCQYGLVNGTCAAPQYNSTQALGAAERILASYVYINTSLSLLPYYSQTNKANVSFVPSSNMWMVDIPYVDPLANNSVFHITLLLSGKNLTLVRPLIETISPPRRTNNSVVSFGTVQIYGKTFCQTKAPFPVYLVVDPYAPGVFAGLAKAYNLTQAYQKELNLSYYFVFTNYSSKWYAGYGIQQTQLLGEYLYCSAQQNDVFGYADNVSKIYDGRPISNQTLYQTAVGSGLNPGVLKSCIANSTTVLSYQAQLAKFYNIQFTPQFIVDCKYSSIPQTVESAINYTQSQLNVS